MTYANIELKKHKADDGNGNIVEMPAPIIHEFMKPFVEALALKYPQWKFVECDARRQWDTNRRFYYVADGFTIMDKREELGTIRIDHWCRTGTRYWVDNFRIDATKSRGSGFKTKHMDKAMKHVVKYFGVRDTTELLEAAEQKALRAKQDAVSGLQGRRRSMEHRLDDQLYRYVLENQYEAFAQWTKDVGVWRAEVDEFPDACRELDEALKINDLINTGKAWLVHIVNSDYIVKQGDTVAIWESDKLPNIVRRNLGMLKLVKDRELISNVGIRVDESTYYVLGENQ